jgi:hypothetical protein
MKRFLLLTILGVLFVTGGALLYADSAGVLSVKPSEMKSGEVQTLSGGGRTITIRRDGDTMNVKIDGADSAEKLVITNGSTIRVDAGHGRHTLVVGPERRHIVIDGFPLDGEKLLPQPRNHAMSWFVCPKDHTTLHVPDDKADQTFKCPVDGTTMEKRKGRGFSFFFDDDRFFNEL